MGKKLLGSLGAVAVSVFLLGACSTASDAPVSAEGSWGFDEQGKPQLTLEADGKLYGTDGCNRLAGSWEQDGERVALGPIASTMMACMDVDTWLLGAGSLEVVDGTLHVFNESGEEIGTLPRQEESGDTGS